MERADGRWAADHPLLRPDQPDWGFRNHTQEGAEAMDRGHVGRVRRLSDFGTTKRWLGVGAARRPAGGGPQRFLRRVAPHSTMITG